MPLGVSAIKCVEKVRQKTLIKNPLTCISNPMGRENFVYLTSYLKGDLNASRTRRQDYC